MKTPVMHKRLKLIIILKLKDWNCRINWKIVTIK